jgi:hypothetical protein
VSKGPVQATAGLSGPSPVGLGNGLGGLEKKKKKSQSKALLDDEVLITSTILQFIHGGNL